jgi:hypothetical protein
MTLTAFSSAEFLRDAITFDFALRNDGDVTIRVSAIKFSESFNDQLLEDGLVRFMKTAPQRIKLEDTIIYPGGEHVLESAKISLECKRETVFAGGDYKLDWRVFLDNSPPSFGVIDLGATLQHARTRKPDGFE